jgi:hypothetical protein
LELSHLVMADFERSVKRIASQPFQLRFRASGVIRRRVPDYLLCTDTGPVVIDVVRGGRLADPEVRRLLAMTRRVIESRGWRYEIGSDPAPVRYLNIRFVSGYRRPWQFDPEVIAAARTEAGWIRPLSAWLVGGPWCARSVTSYQLNGNVSGMRTSIDRAGRLVVPKALRDQAGITAGEVEVSLDGAAIRIEGVAGEEVVEQDGLLLLPTGGPELDSDEVRELRLADQR